MDIGGVHAADMPGTMHEDFKQSDNAVIFKPDASHALAFESARRSQRFEQGVVDLHIQVLGLGIGEAIIDRSGASAAEFSAQGFRVLERESGALSLILPEH